MRSDNAGGVPIGIRGLGVFAPPQVVTAGQLSAETGIPAEIFIEKFGIRQVHRAGADCHVSDMAQFAARAALDDAGLAPADVDLVVYCGSEYKDHVVWSAATNLAHRLGCVNAEAYELYALCAGTPLTLRVVKDMMLAEPEVRIALVVAASKESELVDKGNQRTRFMFSFGDGAGAAVLARGFDRNVILGSASIVDGSLGMSVIRPAGGSQEFASNGSNPPSNGAHSPYLDVPDLPGMRSRLEEVSGKNFLRIASTAWRRSGLDGTRNGHEPDGQMRPSIDFLALVHVKRSMHNWLVRELGAKRSFYLEEYGHMQAADQLVILAEARKRGLLCNGDRVLLAAAGVGYTWAATGIRWGSLDAGR